MEWGKEGAADKAQESLQLCLATMPRAWEGESLPEYIKVSVPILVRGCVP